MYQENGNEGETFWNKFGTLGRKKKAEEVREVVAEGNYAIDSPGMPKSAEMPPEVNNTQAKKCMCFINIVK